ncbi:hypothetical protein GBO21_23115 [Mycobacterium avium subsp. hominissuis]|nr:hypothetical protein [Mycobacterium avium]MBZ4590193.1 hypothetical protein [Mycobacterium avium subsp. hominissuis]
MVLFCPEWQCRAGPVEAGGSRAVVHGDEHVVKFTEACYRDNALQPDPRFAAAVQTAQRRIAPRALGGAATISSG